MKQRGRPLTEFDMKRLAYCQRFGLRPSKARKRDLSAAFMEQLEKCKTDAARRLLLGVSK